MKPAFQSGMRITTNTMLFPVILAIAGILFPIGALILSYLEVYSLNHFASILLFGAVIAAAFSLGILASLPPLRTWIAKVAAFLRRHRSFLALLAFVGLVAALAELMVGDHIAFVREYRYELFWLIAFPAFIASPFIIGFFIRNISDWVHS